MTLQTFYQINLGIGVVAYLGLTVFCIITWLRRITGRATFTASLLTLLFMLVLAFIGIGPVSVTMSILAQLAWITLLIRVIGVGFGNAHDPALRSVVLTYLVALVVALLAVVYSWALPIAEAAGVTLPLAGVFSGELLLAICGLVLLEQVVRNTRDDLRWRLRYLNIGVGTILAFQLIHDACGLLFNAYLPSLVAIQPASFAIAVPFIAVSAARNPIGPLKLNLSRQFVFRSGVLIAAGGLLLAMGAVGYLARAWEGDWIAALLALAATMAMVAAVAVLGSDSVRIRMRRWMDEHLFPSRYDYRDEWRRVTAQLTEPSPDYDLPQQVLRALSGVLQSMGGAIWRLSPAGVLVPVGQLHTRWSQPLSADTTLHLKAFFETHEWVLDLEDLPAAASEALAGTEELTRLPGIRYLIPLMAETRLFGVAALKQPNFSEPLTWEDYDVLKLIARQASGFIALREAERELADADKLNSFSQASAFIIHDVKTIVAQLSLMLENADRHRDNPAFIDDMLITVRNASQRMARLLTQLREGEHRDTEPADLREEVRRAVEAFARHEPVPALESVDAEVLVTADVSKLRDALGHLIQNAIDAASLGGPCADRAARVQVRLCRLDPWAEVSIEDSGPGMEQEFIEKTLFQPFSSTKGVGGMGMGAYQARSYIRSVGGDVSVDSWPGRGTRFTVRVPLARTP